MMHKLQMAPYMNPCKEILTPLSVDPDLADFDTSKYVFTDISYGLSDRERSVVVRETDGTLKVAPWSVRERMNHIYNPRSGREYLTPKMFEEQHLEKIISEQRYLYILDRACCQFEPDDVDYIRVTHRVYSAVNTAQAFHILRSTRHFGPLAFYLAWNQSIDYLLLDIMNRDLISDAKDLISLYCIIHPESRCSVAVSGLVDADVVSVVKAFIETDSKLKAQLELAVQAMEDARKSKEKNEMTSNS
uniref:28S ribosomal protein S22, mitochondrial n=1 Tax=Arion vulgaris TaxID=1028688 RepID=A0A0B6ZYH0_9EUPU